MKGGNSEEKPDVPQVDDGHKQMPPPGNLFKSLEKDKNSHKSGVWKKKGDLHPNEINQQQNIPPPNVEKSAEKKSKNKLKSVLKGELHPNEQNQQQNIPPPQVAMETPKQPMVDGNVQQLNIPPPKRGQRIVDDSVREAELFKLDAFNGDVAKQPALPEM